ncbi:MAG: hypothetical protein NHB15_18915 [Methanosarcina barkeri]|nr:hypothetical protein [Methanosarcina sp. ERenArc_MAG2]
MSRQAIDSAARILGAVPSLIEKGDYTQAFEKAEKAQKLAEKAKVPNLIGWALMAKGEALGAACRLEEALETYQRALGFSSDLFSKIQQIFVIKSFCIILLARLKKYLRKLAALQQQSRYAKRQKNILRKLL